MKRFQIGAEAHVKDFSNGVIEDMLPIEKAKVLSITDTFVTFDIGYDTIKLKLRRAAKWEWVFYESILIRPI